MRLVRVAEVPAACTCQGYAFLSLGPVPLGPAASFPLSASPCLPAPADAPTPTLQTGSCGDGRAGSCLLLRDLYLLPASFAELPARTCGHAKNLRPKKNKYQTFKAWPDEYWSCSQHVSALPRPMRFWCRLLQSRRGCTCAHPPWGQDFNVRGPIHARARARMERVREKKRAVHGTWRPRLRICHFCCVIIRAHCVCLHQTARDEAIAAQTHTPVRVRLLKSRQWQQT
jgi:hypothetical protein